MTDPVHHHVAKPQASVEQDHFEALVNGRPFVCSRVDGRFCLRAELDSARRRRIWKINATGRVGNDGTTFGVFIDHSLAPGIHDLKGNALLTVIYHLTPKRMSRIYHSAYFQQGSITLLECAAGGRLRGTFHFAIPAAGFWVSEGVFDVACADDRGI